MVPCVIILRTTVSIKEKKRQRSWRRHITFFNQIITHLLYVGGERNLSHFLTVLDVKIAFYNFWIVTNYLTFFFSWSFFKAIYKEVIVDKKNTENLTRFQITNAQQKKRIRRWQRHYWYSEVLEPNDSIKGFSTRFVNPWRFVKLIWLVVVQQKMFLSR